MILGIALVLVAAFFQGTFLLPMALTRKWAWEHNWAVFSLFAMWLLNWTLAWVLLPDPWRLYASIPRSDLLLLIVFGAAWGVGAVLFGLGMDRLGLTLGYPLIMGLNAAGGTLVPLLWFSQESLLSRRSLLVLSGTAVALAGIALCSIAGGRKQPRETSAEGRPAFASGLIIGIVAGCLTFLPNLGMSFATGTVSTARAMGASAMQAGNVVWAVFFTLGGLVNLAYCILRVAQNRTFHAFAAPGSLRNLGFDVTMSLMWIASFYCYGAGAARLGAWGPTVGWPILIAGSIGVGVLWGLWKGEWRNAPAPAARLLAAGLLLILLAVLLLASAN